MLRFAVVVYTAEHAVFVYTAEHLVVVHTVEQHVRTGTEAMQLGISYIWLVL